MAEAVISAIIGDVVSRAISLLIGRFSNRQSGEDKLQKICHMLIRIHSVVEEAKGWHITNHGTLQWLSKLMESEYQGRYLLDSIKCQEHQACKGGDKVVPQVSNQSSFNPAKRVRISGSTLTSASSWDGVYQIDMVLKRLQGMSRDLREFIMLLQNCKPIPRPLATNIFRDGQMFGRHVEKEMIINFLLHEDDESIRELGVLPIVGDIGVGKTTMVQHACNDARVRNHFPVILLSSLSCTYIVKENIGTPSDPQELIKGNNLCGKKLLLVFEDVDMHRSQILEERLRTLTCKEGSKVIITANNRRVTTIFGTVEPVILEVLPCPEYWFFFKAHAFTGRDIVDNQRLIMAGKEIAKKLNGSFFGAKIIGEVLRHHPDPMFWCKVLRSNFWGMSPLDDGIGYISYLAKSLLPDHVDMCQATASKGQFPTQITIELARLKGLCSDAPHESNITCWADDVRFADVLLCKSAFPFFNQYYVARCTYTTGSSNGS